MSKLSEYQSFLKTALDFSPKRDYIVDVAKEQPQPPDVSNGPPIRDGVKKRNIFFALKKGPFCVKQAAGGAGLQGAVLTDRKTAFFVRAQHGRNRP